MMRNFVPTALWVTHGAVGNGAPGIAMESIGPLRGRLEHSEEQRGDPGPYGGAERALRGPVTLQISPDTPFTCGLIHHLRCGSTPPAGQHTLAKRRTQVHSTRIRTDAIAAHARHALDAHIPTRKCTLAADTKPRKRF